MINVPGRYKIKGKEKKWLLKRAFLPELPREVLYRRKAGFSLPVARWLREDLRDLLEDRLSPHVLYAHGLFDPSVVEVLKREHLERKRNNSVVLWSLLMFQLWLHHYGSVLKR